MKEEKGEGWSSRRDWYCRVGGNTVKGWREYGKRQITGGGTEDGEGPREEVEEAEDEEEEEEVGAREEFN